MSNKLLKTVKAALPNCNQLPEQVKEILNNVTNSLNDLDENYSKQLWILLHDFIKETSIAEDAVDSKELLESYQCVLNLVQYAINSIEDILSIYDEEHLLKTIMIFQSFYTKKFKYKFKFEIAKMCVSFWKLLAASTENKPGLIASFDTIMTQNFIFTFAYLFDTIKTTTKKLDMKALSTLLWQLCKIVTTLSFDHQDIMNLIVSNLEKNIKNGLFLETETGKMIFADIFTTSQQLFLKFHQNIKSLLPKTNKAEAMSYGEIYFIAWINSNSSMREIIEQQGIFDIISKTLMLRRTGLTFRTYHNALIFLQSLQTHRKHLLFSKVITKLYAPVLWRHLTSEFKEIRCNAIEILARAYPLEKRGEGREVSSRFLVKQQDAFLYLLEDSCPQIRIATVKGICSCMRYFWGSFEDDRLKKCFNLFTRLISESVYEVRKVMYYGFCQLLDENKSHEYFKNPFLLGKMKTTLNDDNEKVRRAFIHFLLKIKKLDSQNTTNDTINFAKIVNLQDIAMILAYEDKANGLLLVELIFDNFIGPNVPDRHATLTRLNMFYKINPTACRKLMIYSEKVLDFDSACQLIFSLLKTLYNAIVKKEARLKTKDKENSIPNKKKCKMIDDSDTDNDTSNSLCNSSNSNSENNEQNEHSNVCCILDCVHCLMILHRNKLIDENNHQQMKSIQDHCTMCLIKVLKFYKEGNAYFSAMSLASLIPVSKLTPHVSAPSAIISILNQLPCDVNCAEEEIDSRKLNCLVYTLCTWKRGYEIIQLVSIWFDEAFKTLNLNDTQYPECTSEKGKKVRFKTDIKECKPMTGILLINSMLTNLQTQESLFSSDINKKNIYDLILYLQRIKPAIENRISSDNVLSDLLSDDVLIELFQLNMKLYILYHSHVKDIDVNAIVEHLTSILNWITNDILNYDLHHKNESTVTLIAKIINSVNYTVMNLCLMTFVNDSFLNNFFIFCATLLHNYLGSRVILSMITTLVKVSKYFSYLKLIGKLGDDALVLTNCVCSIISIFEESKFNEDTFKSVIGDPKHFCRDLTMVILEIHKISVTEFKQIFMSLIETITNIIAKRIQEIDEVDLYEQLTEMPFAAYQLSTVVLKNVKFTTYFSSNAVDIFSSIVYKKDSVMLLSAISYVYTLSFQYNKIKGNSFEPVVRLLYKTLMEYNKTTTLLGNNCTVVNNTKVDQGISALETSDFNNEIIDFKQKGRNVLIVTAKQLRITLSD